MLLQTFSIFVDFANTGYYLSSNRWFMLNYSAFQSSLFELSVIVKEKTVGFLQQPLSLCLWFFEGDFLLYFSQSLVTFLRTIFGHFHSMSESKRLKAPWFLWVGCSPLSKTQAVFGQLGSSTQIWILQNHFC